MANRVQIMAEIADGMRCAICEERAGRYHDMMPIGMMGEEAHVRCVAEGGGEPCPRTCDHCYPEAHHGCVLPRGHQGCHSCEAA